MEIIHSLIVIIFLVSVLTLTEVQSATYTVGDEDEWSTGINYFAWSQKYNFTVGDVLVFNYVSVQHNVYEVTEATYRSCDASVGTIKMYDSGNDQVTMTEAKQYWFICNVPGHCLGGMKFGISVGSQGSQGFQPPPPADKSGSSGAKAWGMSLALGMLLFLFSF